MNVRDKPTSHVKDLSNIEDITPARQIGHAPHVNVDPTPAVSVTDPTPVVPVVPAVSVTEPTPMAEPEPAEPEPTPQNHANPFSRASR